MSPLCPTCHGDCCADKYDDRGKHIPEDDDGFIYWTHSCPDCSDGFAPALAGRTTEQKRAAVVAWLRGQAEMAYNNTNAYHALWLAAEAVERGEHRREEIE